MRNELFKRLLSGIDPAALFESDGLKNHAVLIRRHFPEACHGETHQRSRGRSDQPGTLQEPIQPHGPNAQ